MVGVVDAVVVSHTVGCLGHYPTHSGNSTQSEAHQAVMKSAVQMLVAAEVAAEVASLSGV